MTLKAVDFAQVVDSCGRSEGRKTPQTRMRRGGFRLARGKRRLARKSTAIIEKVRLYLFQITVFSISP
ncbi:MAG: hypothetical protein LPK00_03890 [Bacillaceae bacterium]|nr:hypothetical protein [Bacillaceae bacterium]